MVATTAVEWQAACLSGSSVSGMHFNLLWLKFAKKQVKKKVKLLET